MTAPDQPRKEPAEPLSDEAMALLFRAVLTFTQILGTAGRHQRTQRDRARLERQDWRMN